MALSPKEMREAIIKNLKEKTGKNFDEWVVMIEEDGPKDKKERVKWLKTNHELGHYQAVNIVDRMELNGNSHYENAGELIESLLANKNNQLKELYMELDKKIMSLGDDVKQKPCKGYIPYYRKKQFLILKPKKNTMKIGLSLPNEYSNNLLSKAKNLGGSDRINRMLEIKGKEDISEDILFIIQESYKFN